MSGFWKLAIGLVLVLQTAWSTVVHAAYFSNCHYSMVCEQTGCLMGTYVDSGTFYAYIDVQFVCGAGDSFVCSSNVVACGELSKYDFSCVDLTDYGADGSVGKLLGAVGCNSVIPPTGTYYRFTFDPPATPSGGPGWYRLDVTFYEGTACPGTAEIGSATAYLYYSFTHGWGWATCGNLPMY